LYTKGSHRIPEHALAFCGSNCVEYRSARMRADFL
jgi:hypothetical protein